MSCFVREDLVRHKGCQEFTQVISISFQQFSDEDPRILAFLKRKMFEPLKSDRIFVLNFFKCVCKSIRIKISIRYYYH